MIERLDHVNLQTTQLAEMIAWYENFLHLKQGYRPNFPFDGAWMYAGAVPVVHLVEVKATPPKATDLALEHAAFAAKGLTEFLERLTAADVAFRLVRVPDIPLVQVNVWDPDGNHLHVDFHASEAEGIDMEDFKTSRIKA
ncbi:glyoxalase [Jannaschia sp. EhC01]|nr:glyoxalase [Jannaschia sp. EhC01]